MKFTSTTPQYFSDLSERFSDELAAVSVIQGTEHLKTGHSPLILVDENLDSKSVVSVLCDHSLKHLVQKNTSLFEEDLWTTGHIANRPELYFSEGAKSLLENSTSSYVIEFTQRPDKVKLKEESNKFVADGGNQSLIEAADAVVEELYMNAMIDAPKEGALRGIPAYGKGINTLELERNETRLVISCTDPYGALDVNKFLSRMNEVYSKGAGEVINLRGKGGAGLGCVIMFENSMAMYLGVDKNKCTRVSCVLPIGMNNRQRANVKKSLHRLELES